MVPCGIPGRPGQWMPGPSRSGARPLVNPRAEPDRDPEPALVPAAAGADWPGCATGRGSAAAAGRELAAARVGTAAAERRPDGPDDALAGPVAAAGEAAAAGPTTVPCAGLLTGAP